MRASQVHPLGQNPLSRVGSLCIGANREHIMRFKPRNLRAISEMVIGDVDYFPYRSSMYITEFFQECDLDFVHNGTTRRACPYCPPAVLTVATSPLSCLGNMGE